MPIPSRLKYFAPLGILLFICLSTPDREDGFALRATQFKMPRVVGNSVRSVKPLTFEALEVHQVAVDGVELGMTRAEVQNALKRVGSSHPKIEFGQTDTVITVSSQGQASVGDSVVRTGEARSQLRKVLGPPGTAMVSMCGYPQELGFYHYQAKGGVLEVIFFEDEFPHDSPLPKDLRGRIARFTLSCE